MSIFRRLFREDAPRAALRPLYAGVVAAARARAWYGEDRVSDTVDGRFDMVAAVLSLVLIRLEREGDAGRTPAALLTELFIADMDGQLREFGVGDVVVGKHVGRMMGALGGRLDAYRRGLDGDDLTAAVARNIFREAPPSPEAADAVAARLRALSARIAAVPLDALLTGEVPQP